MPACIFCEIVAGQAPAHRVHEDEDFLAFLDIYPIRPGHTLVIPKRHGPFLRDHPEPIRAELFALGTRLGAAIRASGLPCDDLNYVLNDGPAANQTVAHAHLHLIPRVQRDLPKLARMLLQRPIQGLLGQAPAAQLASQAARIRGGEPIPSS